MPQVSIITAAYNHEKYIAQAIESVLAQTYHDYEMIIGDDCSTDRTLEIAREFERRYPDRIKVFKNERNQGQETTRNLAIQKSRGEYLCLLDSDDFFEPLKLELLVPLLKENPRCGLSYGIGGIFLESGGEKKLPEIKNYPSGAVFESLLEENFLSASAVLFRRECLNEKIKFDSRFKTCGEYPLWLQIAKTWEFEFSPHTVSYWRCHGKNLGTTLSLQAKRELVELFEGFVKENESQNVKNALQQALNQRRYDYLNELYFAGEFKKAKEEANHLLYQLKVQNIFSALTLKSTLLWGALNLLGERGNKTISQAKRSYWTRRHFSAKS